MTLGQIKKMSLRLIDKYAQNGKVIQRTDPNILDYYYKMCDFINFAQVLIAKRCPIVKRLMLIECEYSMNGFDYFLLPKDFCGLYMVTAEVGDSNIIGKISVIGENLLIPTGRGEDMMIMYKAVPYFVDDDTDEEYELELRADLHIVVPLYVASKLISIEDGARSMELLNQFEVELGRMESTDQFGSGEIIGVNNY